MLYFSFVGVSWRPRAYTYRWSLLVICAVVYLIHNFMAVTPSVKLAVFDEKMCTCVKFVCQFYLFMKIFGLLPIHFYKDFVI